MDNNVVLRKGTWFQMRNGEEASLGEIVDFQKDEDHPELYWFKCQIHFDFIANEPTDREKLYSSLDFETFYQLRLLEKEAGEQLLEDAITHARALHEGPVQSIREGFDRAAMERRPRPRTGQGLEAASRQEIGEEEDPVMVPEPAYLNISAFSIEEESSLIASKYYTIPLGSGSMKTILKMYSAQPKEFWETINASIEETGHLLLTYTNIDLRQTIVNQKINYLLNHETVTLKVKELYKLNFKDQETEAMYLGDGYWTTLNMTSNTIDGLRGKSFSNIDNKILNKFTVTPIYNGELSIEIEQTVLPSIDPQQLERLADAGEAKVVCVTSSERNAIPSSDISKNWEKAFEYNYYTSAELDPRLDLTAFQAVDNIKKLATII